MDLDTLRRRIRARFWTLGMWARVLRERLVWTRWRTRNVWRPDDVGAGVYLAVPHWIDEKEDGRPARADDACLVEVATTNRCEHAGKFVVWELDVNLGWERHPTCVCRFARFFGPIKLRAPRKLVSAPEHRIAKPRPKAELESRYEL